MPVAIQPITRERVIEAIDSGEYIGFCTACGHEQGGCEPDMEHGECENCGTLSVYGAEELVIRFL